jgi:hypothetical protein
MLSKGMLSVVLVAATLAVGAGCKGSEEVAKTDTPPPPPADPASAGTAAAASTSDVASYPTQVVMGGTITTTQALKVYQAADPSSTLLTSLGPGTLVETKARYGDWMLINWPSGVGKLSPGWVQSAYLVPVKQVITDAGAPDAAAPVDAGAKDAGTLPTPTPVDAGPAPTDAGTKTRPIIRLPTKK